MTDFKMSRARLSLRAPATSMWSSTAATYCTEAAYQHALAEMALAPLRRLASSGVPVLLVPGNHERGRIPYPLLAVHEHLHADLPQDVAVTLSGHIHRHQVLRPAGCPPVIYAGSVERTSFAEAPEVKGFVVLQLTNAGIAFFEFRPLPARPMATRSVFFGDANAVEVHARLTAAIESTPDDAVVKLQVTGAMPPTLTAATLRAIAGARTVTLAFRAADHRDESEVANAAT